MSDKPKGQRPWAVLWFAAALLAFLVGGAFTQARASHGTTANYHCNITCHGFVHGSSTSDNSFHSRQEAGGNTDYRYCNIYLVDFGPEPTFIGSTSVSGYDATCNYWVDPARNVNEGASYAFVEAFAGGTNPVPYHVHPDET